MATLTPWIQICDDKVELPLEKDGITLKVSKLRAIASNQNVLGLKFKRSNGFWKWLFKNEEDIIEPPSDGWKGMEYVLCKEDTGAESMKRPAGEIYEGISKRLKSDEGEVMFVNPVISQYWKNSKECITQKLTTTVILPNGNTIPTSSPTIASLTSYCPAERVKIFGLHNNSLRLLLSTPPLPWRDIFLYLSSSLPEAITTEYTLVIWKDTNCEKFEIHSMMTELTNGNYILLPDKNIELSPCVENSINISRSTKGSEIITISGNSEVESTPEPEKPPEPEKSPELAKKPRRSTLFKKEVNNKCNVCAFCGDRSEEHLESAHIVDYARQQNATIPQSIISFIETLEMGIDNTENGILLCSNCHKSFGLGRIAMYKLHKDYIMLVLLNNSSPFHLKPINGAFTDIHPELVKFHLQNSIARYLRNNTLIIMKANADVDDDDFYDDDVENDKVQASKALNQRVQEWLLCQSLEDSDPTSQEESIVEESCQEEGSNQEEQEFERSSQQKPNMQYQNVCIV